MPAQVIAAKEGPAHTWPMRSRTVLRWLQMPGVAAWRWFTGQPLDGVPRTDAGWFTKGHKALDRDAAPRPPASLAAEVRRDVQGFRIERCEAQVRRDLGREFREVERQVLAEDDPREP
jgi:hypothetical protein